MPRARRLDVAKLWQSNTNEALSTEIRSRLTTPADGEGSSKWSALKTSVYGSTEKILGSTQLRRSDWISGRTLQRGYLVDNPAKIGHWRKYLEYHLKFDEQPITPSRCFTAEFQPSPAYAVSCDLPPKDEVADAIERLRNSNASGEDGILAEIYKSCVDTLAYWLHGAVGVVRYCSSLVVVAGRRPPLPCAALLFKASCLKVIQYLSQR
ncbi:unnamed protein product [Dibothriocephalus latus]|uniref:Uncharacterized protein n=1 Tax=Dibothriocephalus latus TaxID=60516 RepID=A0A3P6S552_DIBLA|nr:unnamed protein product [Dibothriocephalus latus]